MPDIIYPIIKGETKLPFYLTGIGICDPENRVDRKSGLISHQFLFTIGGKGILEVDGESYEQTEGSFFYLSPGVPHRYYPKEEDWKTAWLVFRGNGLSEIMTGLGFPDYKTAVIPSRRSMSLFNKIRLSASDSINGAEKCSCLIYELILEVSRAINSVESNENEKKDYISRAVSYIDENYSKDIALGFLAEMSGISVQHFCRSFRKEMEMRPLEYVAQRRISEAKRMLLSTDMSITEIAENTGYSGLTYFGMVFRKYEGISPKEFRRYNKF